MRNKLEGEDLRDVPGMSTLKYFVIVSAWILIAVGLAQLLGCATGNRNQDMTDNEAAGISQWMKDNM